MTDKPVDLDKHRGMAAQKATDLRRLLSEVEANATILRRAPGRAGNPARRGAGRDLDGSRREGALSARSLRRDAGAGDTRRRKLVAAVLDDFDRLGREP